MRIDELLHNLLHQTIHKKRIATLLQVITAALKIKKVNLTHLGRGIENHCTERSNIRKVDRLFSNEKLMSESLAIYKEMSARLLGKAQRPVILVDSVKLPHPKIYALRASCAISGRTHTLYELVYEAKRGNTTLNQEFLENLKQVIPPHCRPIIVTDAGFHNPWFKQVLSYNWDFIGRLRGLKIYRQPGCENYLSCRDLWGRATSTPRYLGQLILNRDNPLECHFYLYRKGNQGRSTGYTSNNAIQHYKRSAREPWLLASSLVNEFSAKKIVRMYQKRMSIEESFRDMKSHRYGVGLAEFGLKKPRRFIVMLLVLMLVNFISCCLGQIMEKHNLHRDFQANSTRKRRVLSYFYLGFQAVRKKVPITIEQIHQVLLDIAIIVEAKYA